MASYSLRRLCKALHLVHGQEKKKLFELGPFSAQTALYARAAQEEDMKKKKKKKEKKKEKKKGSPDAAAEGERDRLRFDDLVSKALAAPSPVRHVKEKERLREQEMEKYGLMTKERQIELEQIKAREKAKEKAKKKKGDEEEAASVEEEEKPPLTKEEGMRLAKEYSRLLMHEDRKLHAGETIRLRLKNEAIAALPRGLQEAARVPDMTPFPGLSPATLTPPIPGFTYEYDRRIVKHAEDQP
eukprot:c15266_g1_i1 orf=257-982(-)